MNAESLVARGIKLWQNITNMSFEFYIPPNQGGFLGRQKSIIILIVFVMFVGFWILKLVWDAGQFNTLAPHFEGTCREITGVIGPEDITIHSKTGIAYISAYDRRAVLAGDEGFATGVFSYDTNLKDARPVLLTTGPGPDFRPHGLSLYVSPDGNDLLFDS